MAEVRKRTCFSSGNLSSSIENSRLDNLLSQVERYDLKALRTLRVLHSGIYATLIEAYSIQKCKVVVLKAFLNLKRLDGGSHAVDEFAAELEALIALGAVATAGSPEPRCFVKLLGYGELRGQFALVLEPLHISVRDFVSYDTFSSKSWRLLDTHTFDYVDQLVSYYADNRSDPSCTLSAVALRLSKSQDCIIKKPTSSFLEKDLLKCRLLDDFFKSCLKSQDVARAVPMKCLKQPNLDFLGLLGVEGISDIGEPGLYPFPLVLQLLPSFGLYFWIAWSLKLVEAIDYMHQHGVIHRDLKLENLMVRPDCNLGSFVLIDFKNSLVSKDPSKSFEKGLKIFSTHPMGTPCYMAPEAFKAGHVTEKLDIWGLGCIFLELFGGCTPFEDFTTEEVILHLCRLQEPPEIPSSLCESLLSDMERWVHYRIQTEQMDLNILKKFCALKSHIRLTVTGIISDCFNLDPRTRPSASELVASFRNLESSTRLFCQECLQICGSA